MRTHQRITFDIPRSQGQEVKQSEDPDYIFNSMIIEIFNNWKYVMDLWNRFKGGSLKEVDPLERDWLNFAISNKLEMDKYIDGPNNFFDMVFKNKTI